jgi:hypothetical protein
MKNILPLAFLFFAFGCTTPLAKGPEVRVTLSDGQVLLGCLSTRSFALKTGLGDFDFDSSDAGELGLLEGKNVQQSKRKIRLWLRNGSEFVGYWQEPKIDLLFAVGGEERNITVPIAKLERLQFKGQAVWSQQAVFRIQTKYGDDFFVDVTRNRLAFQTEFGEIRPFLSEINSMEPLDKNNKKWRVHLSNGTVLMAHFKQRSLDLKLAMGPETIQVPLLSIKHMDRQQLSFGEQPKFSGGEMQSGLLGNTTGAAPKRRVVTGLYYDNRNQKIAKRDAAQSWQSVTSPSIKK